jgi:hypothetical protein
MTSRDTDDIFIAYVRKKQKDNIANTLLEMKTLIFARLLTEHGAI